MTSYEIDRVDEGSSVLAQGRWGERAERRDQYPQGEALVGDTIVDDFVADTARIVEGTMAERAASL